MYILNFHKIILLNFIFNNILVKINSNDDIIKSFEELTYPKVKVLDNGNVLFVTYEGIFSYNSDLSMLYYSYIFSEDQKFIIDESIMKNTLNQVGISQFSDDEGGSKYVVIYAKNFIYCLSENGEVLFYKELINKIEVEYPLNLMALKYNNNEYYFIISFNAIKQENFYFYFFKIKINAQKIDFVWNQEMVYPSDCKANLNTLSSEVMILINEKVLTCFTGIQLYADHFFYIIAFTFKFESSFKHLMTSPPFKESDLRDINVIKTTLNEEKTKAFVCYLIESPNKAKCLYFDIIENKFYDVFLIETRCNSKYYGLNIFYFKETKEFIFSCNDNENLLYILKELIKHFMK